MFPPSPLCEFFDKSHPCFFSLLFLFFHIERLEKGSLPEPARVRATCRTEEPIVLLPPLVSLFLESRLTAG